MLSDSQLSDLYDCATTSKRLSSAFSDNSDLDTVIKYGELFKACHSINSLDYIRKAENLKDAEKVQLERIVQEKLKNNLKTKETVPWNVNIVIGNSHVAKSLRPVIDIKIGNEKFEFDIDSFAQFREQLARTVLSVNPQ